MQIKLGLLLNGVLLALCLHGGSVTHAAVVMDQIGVASSYVHDAEAFPPYAVSQFNEAGLEDFNALALDDFTLGSAGWQITGVEGLFQAAKGFSAFSTVAGYQVNIFSSVTLAASGLQGDVASLLVSAGSGASVSQINGGDLGLVSLELNLNLPNAGTYWIAIAPVVTNSEESGTFYLQSGGAQGAISPGNQNGHFANPGEGHGEGALTSAVLDYAYRVTAVPEPAGSALAAIAAGMALLRRGRRSALRSGRETFF